MLPRDSAFQIAGHAGKLPRRFEIACIQPGSEAIGTFTLVARTETWSAVNSGSYESAGLARMRSLLLAA